METARVQIWPLWVRIFHWVLAVIIILDAFVLEDGDPPHRYLGYLALGIVLVRFLMGFVGKGHENFKNFPVGPSHIKKFLSTHFQKAHHYEGHNPLASLTYFVMWFLVIALGVSGWMLGLDAFWGNEMVEEIHGLFSGALIALVVFHLIGISIDAILYKRKTWMGMISGKK